MKISVITPFSRGIKELKQLIRDFKNQTFPNFEWIIVHDGNPSPEIAEFMGKNCPSFAKFVSIEKDRGDMKTAPGTKPRNHGLQMAKGDYVIFCDDDDRYKSSYLEIIASGMIDSSISVVQMSCQESRIYRNGNPQRIVLVPEVGLSEFPVICHVGTPCFAVPRKWALEDPWQHEPEHDFRFIKRIVDKHKPTVFLNYGMLVDVDGLVLQGVKGWVRSPRFS
mgnify:CR=1 FL=1